MKSSEVIGCEHCGKTSTADGDPRQECWFCGRVLKVPRSILWERMTQLEADLAAAQAENQRLRAEIHDRHNLEVAYADQPIKLAAAVEGLETIRRDEGRVCAEFETCNHAACASSYAAWAIADEVLQRIIGTPLALEDGES